MGDITFSNLSYESAGSQKKVVGKMTFSSDYATGGDVFNIKKIGLAQLKDLTIEDSSGYAFNFVNTNPLSYANIMVLLGAGGGTIGSTSAGTPAGTNSAPALTMDSYTPAGGVAAPVLTMDSYTPAGSVAAPVLTMDSYTPAGTNGSSALSMDSYTPAGTNGAPALTMDSYTPAGTNAASAVTALYLPDYSPIVKPAIKLTYNADPSGGLSANPLYIVEALAGASANCGQLQSNCAATTSVLGETADGTVYGAAGSARFWVTHNATPSGVQIYVNESSSYQLECVSPTGKDVAVLMPMENGAGIGTAFVKVVVHHNASAATGKALSFDDNGAADGQLIFVATDTSDHAIPPSDITAAFCGVGVGTAGGNGSAAAQVLTGTPATLTGSVAAPAFTGTPATLTGTAAAPTFTGTPATLTGTNGAPAFTGTPATLTGTNGAPAFTGTPATLTGSVAAPTFTGSAMGTHSHTSTGGASGEATAHTNFSTLVVDFVAYGY